MVFSGTAPADPTSRFEKSLVSLTSRFWALLQRSPNGVLNLQEAAEDLKSRGRRMYDITNVLEGVGLVEKVGKKCIRRKRAFSSQDLSEEELNAATALEKEIETLNDQEKLLDMQLAMKKQSLAYTIAASARHSYVHFQDLCQAFQENTILTVKAPNNTDMNISESDVYLNAISGRIDVMMVEKDRDGHILATSIPIENQADAFEYPEDLRANGVYDPKKPRGEVFVGGYEPRFTYEEAFDGGYDSRLTHENTFGVGYDSRLTHEEAFGYYFNHGGSLNEVSAVDNPGSKRNCEFGVGPPAKRRRLLSCGDSMDHIDDNDLVELDVLMKAVQEIQGVDSTAVSNAEEVAASNSLSHINFIQEIQAVDNSENEDAIDNTEFVNSSSIKKAAQEIYVGDNIEKYILEKGVQEIPADENAEKDKEAEKSFSLGQLGYGQDIVRAEKEVNGAVDSFRDVVMEHMEATRDVDTRKKSPGTRINPAMPAFKCDKCGKCFPVKAGLYNHQVNMHKTKDIVNLSPLKILASSIEEITPRNIQVKTDAPVNNTICVENNPDQIGPDQLFGIHASRVRLTNIEPSFHEESEVGDDHNMKADDYGFNQELLIRKMLVFFIMKME